MQISIEYFANDRLVFHWAGDATYRRNQHDIMLFSSDKSDIERMEELRKVFGEKSKLFTDFEIYTEDGKEKILVGFSTEYNITIR